MSVAVLNPTLDHVLVTAGIVWLIARQFTWRDVSDLLRWPVLLLAFGAISATLGVLHGERISLSGAAVFAAELLLVAATGTLMGTRYRFRDAPAGQQCRLNRSGVVLWAVFVCIRVAALILAAQLGAKFLETTGAVLMSFATNRLAASLVVQRRAQQRIRVHAPS
jgi:hypothetical protein